MNNLTDEIGDLDVIIDDGSQINEHVIETFKILFPKLKNGEVYVIENSQSSYWEKNGRASKNLNNSKTMMNYFKSLTESLNKMEFTIKNKISTKINNINSFLSQSNIYI